MFPRSGEGHFRPNGLRRNPPSPYHSIGPQADICLSTAYLLSNHAPPRQIGRLGENRPRNRSPVPKRDGASVGDTVATSGREAPACPFGASDVVHTSPKRKRGNELRRELFLACASGWCARACHFPEGHRAGATSKGAGTDPDYNRCTADANGKGKRPRSDHPCVGARLGRGKDVAAGQPRRGERGRVMIKMEAPTGRHSPYIAPPGLA